MIPSYTRQKPSLNTRITNIRQRLQADPQHKDQLRQKLTGLRVQRFQHKFNNPAVPSIKDAQYNTTVTGLRDTYNQTQAQLLNQNLATEQDYGFTDTSNPYSRAALLQQSYKNSQARTLNSYAGAGQYYSGALSNAESAGRAAYGSSEDALFRNYQADKFKLATLGQRASSDFSAGRDQAAADALQRRISAKPDPTMAPKPPGWVTNYLQSQIKEARKHGNKKRIANLQARLQGLANG